MNIFKIFTTKGQNQPAANTIKKEVIHFPNNREAIAVFPGSTDKPEDIIAALEIKPYKAVLLVLGGADNIDDKGILIPQLTQLFSRGIARAAIDADALLIDGGIQGGVLTLMGQGVADRGNKSMLIGVASENLVKYPGSTNPEQKIPLEPNHSHFVLVEGANGQSETAGMYNLATLLIKRPSGQNGQTVEHKVPALAILAGGDQITKDMVLQAIRQNLIIVVVEGSGGFADEVAGAYEKRNILLVDDPVMAEIVTDGKLYFHSLSNPVPGIEKLIIRILGIDKVLMQAWETFAVYDLNANFQQKRFDKLQQSIIIIGVIGTALAIIKQVAHPNIPYSELHFPFKVMYQLLILIPILLTVLITVANRFKQGNKWLLLRAAAESIKREIFRYRTRTNEYRTTPEQQLALRIEDITTRTMRTEVNSSYLEAYNKEHGFPPYMYATQGADDGFSDLTPDRYVEVRLGDQLNYFKKRAVRLGTQLTWLSWSIFIIGGIGTYLAAIDLQVWIALTTAIVAALGTYLGYRQTENTLTKYNQTATNLDNVKAWWNALSSDEQSLQQNIDTLVDHTEQVLQVELDGWIQQMQNALAELRKNQEPSPEKEENKAPVNKTLQSPHDPNKNNNGSNGKQASATNAKEKDPGSNKEANDDQKQKENTDDKQEPVTNEMTNH